MQVRSIARGSVLVISLIFLTSCVDLAGEIVSCGLPPLSPFPEAIENLKKIQDAQEAYYKIHGHYADVAMVDAPDSWFNNPRYSTQALPSKTLKILKRRKGTIAVAIIIRTLVVRYSPLHLVNSRSA